VSKAGKALRREAASAREMEQRIQETRALAPLAHEKPELVNQPIARLWPKRRALLIVNSKSGPNRDSLSHVRDIVDCLGTFRIRAEVRVKLRKSQARKEARAAAGQKRFDFVIAAGGDGTVEAVASGLVGSSTTLGIIPLGTFNNVATSLGIPRDMREACALIACGAARRIDVGLMVARYMRKPKLFLEVSTVGVGALLGTLGQHVEKGRWEEAAQAIPGVAGLSLTPTQVRLDDGPPHTASTLLVTISNAPRSGAGLDLAPRAKMDDGLLDVRVFQDLDKAALLAHFLPVMPEAPPEGIWNARARSVEIQTAQPMPVSIESKLVGVTPARFKVVAGGLSVIVGDTDALLQPATHAAVQASHWAATLFAQPSETVADGAEIGLGTRALQTMVPLAGRTAKAMTSARPLALPLATAAAGLAAGALLRRATQSVGGKPKWAHKT
jgi:diacylglycerol kinase (ATP)